MSAVLLHLFKRGRILHLCENLSFDRFCIEIHDENMTVDKKVKKPMSRHLFADQIRHAFLIQNAILIPKVPNCPVVTY